MIVAEVSAIFVYIFAYPKLVTDFNQKFYV